MYPNNLKPSRQDILPPVPSRPMQTTPDSHSYPTSPSPPRQPSNQSHPYSSNPYQQPVEPKKGILKSIILVTLVILLVGGAAYGGYYYANNYSKKQHASVKNGTQGQNLESSIAGTANGEAKPSADTTHFVLHAGYPYDLGAKKKISINLGIPGAVQGVTVVSGNNNRGQEQYYTDKYNDELGRWDIGFPDHYQSSASQISVLSISKSWLALSQQGNHAFDDTAQKLDTPAEKQAYVAKIKDEATACVKEKAKGFTTKDNVFNVCFSIIPGLDAYDPILVLRGYGEAEGQQMLLTGFVRLEEGKTYDEATNKQLLKDAESGKLADSTLRLINIFIASLSQTTLNVDSVQ